MLKRIWETVQIIEVTMKVRSDGVVAMQKVTDFRLTMDTA